MENIPREYDSQRQPNCTLKIAMWKFENVSIPEMSCKHFIQLVSVAHPQSSTWVCKHLNYPSSSSVYTFFESRALDHRKSKSFGVCYIHISLNRDGKFNSVCLCAQRRAMRWKWETVGQKKVFFLNLLNRSRMQIHRRCCRHIMTLYYEIPSVDNFSIFSSLFWMVTFVNTLIAFGPLSVNKTSVPNANSAQFVSDMKSKFKFKTLSSIPEKKWNDSSLARPA